jgi:DNA-binding HxlR family transcriptional regulator
MIAAGNNVYNKRGGNEHFSSYFYGMPDVLLNKNRFYNPVDYVFKLIGGTWKVPILWRLRKKDLRYSEIEKDIPHISQKMLTKALKELEGDKIISKIIFAEVPPKVIYSLTEKGKNLIPLIELIRNTGIELLQKEGIDYEQMIREEKKK